MAQAKRYNLTGTVTNLKTTKDKDGQPVVSFKLAREGKKAQHCVAFTKRAESFLGSFKQGDTVKLFGTFEPHSFENAEGEKITYNRFNILWSGVPGRKEVKADEASAEVAQAQADQAADVENPFATA
jgi:single-stranded DNA-binding protein